MLRRASSFGKPAPLRAATVIERTDKVAKAEAAKQVRKARATALLQVLSQDSELTALQELSVTAATRRRYHRSLGELTRWVETLAEKPATELEWDRALAELMDSWFADGRPVNHGEVLLAAFTWRAPQYGRDGGGRMAICRQALKGWRRVAPTGGRLPLPMAVVAMMAMTFLQSDQWDLALLLLTMVEAYCRPNEPLRMRCKDLVPGQPGPRQLGFTSLLLHPFELGTPAKNYSFDQTVLLDLPRHAPLAAALLKHARGRDKESQLFRVEAGGLHQQLRGAAEQLRLSSLGEMHSYRMRHTGASYDTATRARPLEEVQRRGRWNDPRSLRKYEHGGRLNELMSRLPPEVQVHALECERVLPQVLRRERAPCRCPW